MELDAMKELWKEAGERKDHSPHNSDIMGMLNKSSNSPIAKMMKNVLMEMILVIVLFGAVAVYFFTAFNSRFNSVAWVYVVMASLCTFYYYRKWKLLYNMQCLACQVKSNLKRQMNTLDQYIRFDLFAGTAMVPLVFIFLGLLFYYKFPAGVLRPVLPAPAEITFTTWLLWTVALAVLTTFVYFANRWMIRKLYGRHILTLKQLLGQMEE